MNTLSLLSTDAAAAEPAAAQDNSGASAADASQVGQPADPAATGTKPADSQADPAKVGEVDKKPGEEDKPQSAPEKYEAFKMPDGFEVDAELLGEFEPTLKELGLSQEAAQKVIDFAPKLIEKTQQEAAAKVLDEVGLADRASWAGLAKVDKEFGGDKLPENMAVARKAIDAFASPELKALLNKTGMGNHPELIRAFFRAGKAISEDTYVPGGKTTTTSHPAQSFYPTMQK